MTDDNMIHVEGMQRVDCRDCGQYLGFQSDDVPILWEEWVHTRCPARLAKRWGLTREEVETLTRNVQASLGASFVDLLPTNDEAAVLRTRIGAEHVLEFLLRRGYKVSEQDCTCIEDKTVSNYCALHGDPTAPGGDCK